MTTTNLPTTEAIDLSFVGLDIWADAAILGALLDGQRRAVDAATAAIPALSKAAQLVTASLQGEGRLIYVAAGSPALISLGDALELPQTFGIPRDRIVLRFAGGHSITENLTGPFEDDEALGIADMAALDIAPRDSVIAVSASGSTPYTVAALATARQRGASTIAIAGNAGAPLFQHADVAVLLDAGPEVISGSTRMGAGTAQKVALNLLSTLVGVRLGHVHDNHMVNVNADNLKLKKRAERMVAAIAKVTGEAAAAALSKTNGQVKPAILIAAGATMDRADQLLKQHEGVLRRALAELLR
ncbi:MAG: N-acetylmuramic acid 6-phosphate etherase [Devosia sp.]